MMKTNLILVPFSFPCHIFAIRDFEQTNFGDAVLV